MKWISCDGGPHILMERHCMENWEGTEQPSNGRIVTAISRFDPDNPSATDYDLACDMNDYIGKIDLKGGSAIVIIDDVPMSSWVTDKYGVGHIVILYTWENANYKEEIPDIINNLKSSDFIDSGIVFKTTEPELFLFPASDIPIKPIYDFDTIHLIPGTYKIYRLDSFCSEKGEIRVFKFLRE